MKKSWKKLFAAGLTCAVIVAVGIPAAQAQAATTKPSLNKTEATVSVGQTLQLKVKQKVSGSTYTWTSAKPKVATVNKNGKVKGVKAGTANIKCQVTAPSKTYNLKCKVTVSSAVKVATQKELRKALNNDNVTDITVATKDNVRIKVKEGDYSDKTLTINAPEATINNYGVFKTVTVKKIKPETFRERISGNRIVVKALEGNVVVAKNSTVKAVRFAKAGANVTVNVKSGCKLTLVNVRKSQTVKVISNGEIGRVKLNQPNTVINAEGSKAVPIVVTATAANSTINASVPVNVTAKAAATIVLDKAAAGSTITVANDTVKVAVTNNTSEPVLVTNAATGEVSVALPSDGKVAFVQDDATGDYVLGLDANTNYAIAGATKSDITSLNAKKVDDAFKSIVGGQVTAANVWDKVSALATDVNAAVGKTVMSVAGNTATVTGLFDGANYTFSKNNVSVAADGTITVKTDQGATVTATITADSITVAKNGTTYATITENAVENETGIVVRVAGSVAGELAGKAGATAITDITFTPAAAN